MGDENANRAPELSVSKSTKSSSEQRQKNPPPRPSGRMVLHPSTGSPRRQVRRQRRKNVKSPPKGAKGCGRYDDNGEWFPITKDTDQTKPQDIQSSNKPVKKDTRKQTNTSNRTKPAAETMVPPKSRRKAKRKRIALGLAEAIKGFNKNFKNKNVKKNAAKPEKPASKKDDEGGFTAIKNKLQRRNNLMNHGVDDNEVIEEESESSEQGSWSDDSETELPNAKTTVTEKNLNSKAKGMRMTQDVKHNPEMDARAPKPLKKKREVEATGKNLNSGKSKHDVKKTALMAEIRKQASLKTKRKKKRLEQKPATKNALIRRYVRKLLN